MEEKSRLNLRAEQQERLQELLAAWDEGEDEDRWERLRQQEEDQETLAAVHRLLEDTEFARGGDLSPAQMARFLTLVRALAPNPNLDARLLRTPDGPDAFNRDLRHLLFGEQEIAVRLRLFLSRRRAGAQTAMQLLCAHAPTQWPLVTRAAMETLGFTAEQKRIACAQARERYGLGEEAGETAARSATTGCPDNDPVLRLLSDAVALEAAQAFLRQDNYIQVHRVMTQRMGVARGRTGERSRILSVPYAPAAAITAATTVFREPVTVAYEPVTPSPAPDTSEASEQDLLRYLEEYIAAKGFTYPAHTVRNYYISLQSRSFALLAGLSGTGKTRLTGLFAEALTGDLAENYLLLPVRPDWNDSTPLLGYVNLLADSGQGRFVSTPFLDFLRRADRPENAHRAYFVCLDEMNLTRVEHYFAEVLSAMETPDRTLLLPGNAVARLPSNLFMIGTLNLDEATHNLSRKVLDRANTLSFQEVRLIAPDSEETIVAHAAAASEVRQALFLTTRVGSVAAARRKLRTLDSTGTDYAASIVEALQEVNAILEPHALHFAYRVRDEILRYCANSFDRQGLGLLVPETPADVRANLRMALDIQMVQKILPRMTGTRDQLDAPIRELRIWAEAAGFDETTHRLTRLLLRLERDGYASFDMG